MKVYLISDTHFNHANIATYCDRPANFTEIIIRNWKQIVKPDDVIIHLGDVFIGKSEGWTAIHPELPGKKILVRGNHDQRSVTWYMANGFDACLDAMVFRGCWLTHKPSEELPAGCQINVHGHLHNIWHGFKFDGGNEVLMSPRSPWHRLFAVEYTDYMPIEFDKFVNHPDKYLARGRVR